MANTKSAKKAIRSSERKKVYNQFWRRRIKEVSKELSNKLASNKPDVAIIKEDEKKLYKVVDKAAKNNVIHKNKARRIKSRFAKKIAAHEQVDTKAQTTKSKSTKTKTKSSSSAKSKATK